MNPDLQTDPELRSAAHRRGLLWTLALALLAGLLVWDLQGGTVGATGVQSAEVSLQALGSSPDSPDFNFDFDVDDAPAPQPALSLLYHSAIVTAVITEGCRLRCGGPPPARAPPSQAIA